MAGFQTVQKTLYSNSVVVYRFAVYYIFIIVVLESVQCCFIVFCHGLRDI